MVPPTLQQWLFSIKTFAAATLALTVGLWLDLPRPYWAVATVYIASNPLSGATRSKAVFRVFGTLVGAVVSVVLVPNLVNAPVLLVLAMALWTAACLYVSLLDRSPRSYVFMLAGYTTALIGFPAVDSPQAIFDLALSRTEEIVLGILAAGLVSGVVFPRSVGPVISERLRTWLRHMDENAKDALSRKMGETRELHRLRLAADTSEIENLSTHLAYEAPSGHSVTGWVRQLQPRMLMLLPVLSSISDRLGELADCGGPLPGTAYLIERVHAFLGPGEQARTDTNHLAEAIADEIESRRGARDWRSLLDLSLLMRLRDLVQIRSDCTTLSTAAELGLARLEHPLSYPIATRIARVRHRDHGLALISAVIAAITICLCCTFWIASAWPDGGSAAMMAAVASCLFAAQDDPVPSLMVFTKWTVGAVAVASAYHFAILPNVHHLETLVLVLAPVFLGLGLLMASPSTYLVGLAVAVNSASLLALQEMYSIEAASFMNSSHALIGGLVVAAVLTALLRPIGAEWSAWRLVRSNRATLSQAASTRSANDEARIAGLMLDRLMLLAPRVAASGHSMPKALHEVRAGFNILDLHRARHGLAVHSRRRVDAVMGRLMREKTPLLPGLLPGGQRYSTTNRKSVTSGPL